MAEDPRPGETAQETAAPDAAAIEPGAPVPPDAIDSELIRLPAPRPRRSPILAAAVIGLGGLLLYRLHGDIGYALRPTTPVDLGQARAAAAGLAAAEGSYVMVRGMPDYRNAVALEAKGERSRGQIFRLLGTGSRLLVSTGNPAERPRQEPLFSGRLRRFDDLPHAATLRGFYEREARTLRALDLQRLRALPAGALPTPLRMQDRAGEDVQLDSGDELLIGVAFPQDVRVLLPKSKFPSEPDARQEVRRLGLPAGPGVETRDDYGYVLRLPEDGKEREAAVARIDAQGLIFQGRVETYRAPLSKVAVAPEGLVLPGPKELRQPTVYAPAAPGASGAEEPGHLVPVADEGRTLLPWARLRAVEISEPVAVAADAFVILEQETPQSVRWTLAVFGLLVLSIAFNLWYLWRGVKTWRQAA
jgi:hypothetical protein